MLRPFFYLRGTNGSRVDTGFCIRILESGKTSKEISNVKEYDLKKEREVKESIIRVYKAAFPRDFNFIVQDLTWDTALEELTKQIRNQRK